MYHVRSTPQPLLAQYLWVGTTQRRAELPDLVERPEAVEAKKNPRVYAISPLTMVKKLSLIVVNSG